MDLNGALIGLSRSSATLGAFSVGALVERRILLCGLTAGALVLTLAFSWRRHDAAPATHGVPETHKDGLVSERAVASNPFGPSLQATTRPDAAAAPAAVAPAESAQSRPQSEPPPAAVDDTPVRGDRGAERGARSR